MFDRYEARGKAVYDSEEDRTVVVMDTEARAKSTADHKNDNERNMQEFDSMMRSNRSVCV